MYLIWLHINNNGKKQQIKLTYNIIKIRSPHFLPIFYRLFISDNCRFKTKVNHVLTVAYFLCTEGNGDLTSELYNF